MSDGRVAGCMLALRARPRRARADASHAPPPPPPRPPRAPGMRPSRSRCPTWRSTSRRGSFRRHGTRTPRLSLCKCSSNGRRARRRRAGAGAACARRRHRRQGRRGDTGRKRELFLFLNLRPVLSTSRENVSIKRCELERCARTPCERQVRDPAHRMCVARLALVVPLSLRHI